MFRILFFTAAQAFKYPIASGLCVRHCLQGREGLRGNNKKGLGWVEILDRLGEVRAVDIGDEAKRHGSLAVVLQSLVGHHRPEVGAADTDVNDVANALAGMALPCASPASVGKVSHLVEHGVDCRDHVLTINHDGSAFWGTQSDMQDSPVFRDIDLLAPEHGIDALS